MVEGKYGGASINKDWANLISEAGSNDATWKVHAHDKKHSAPLIASFKQCLPWLEVWSLKRQNR